MDSIIVVMDFISVVGDAVIEVIDVVVKVDKVLPECFEGYHKFSFLLESPLVLLLIPDLFPLIEVINLVPEVASWDISVFVVVRVYVVGWLWVVVIRVMNRV